MTTKYWIFSFSISPSSEYSGLISLKIDWFDLLAVQGTFRSLLQHHGSNASILWCSAFLRVQLSQPYVITIWTFVSRMMSPLFNTLSRFVIAFLLRSNRLLISWLQSRPTVIFSSVTQSCPTLCDPMDCSTPGLPVHHQLLKFTQTHVHWIGDAIQPPHPLSAPSPPTLNLSQHQGLFKWISSSHEVAKVLEFQLQHQSFQWIFRNYFL